MFTHIDTTDTTHWMDNYNNLQVHLLEQINLDEKQHHIQDKIISYDEPLIKFVNNMIQHAQHQQASDIHIEPFESICRIRYRQHGILHIINEIPRQFAERIAMRLKVMAQMDIAERRLPQDGRIQIDKIDIRINTCPTLFGEKIVLRLLNTGNRALTIDELNMNEQQKELFLTAITQAQGMILVTGPTGSGKTVTLYSALHHLNQIEKNISTVEDPIEIRLAGINQININTKIGLDFATVLRALLRQDPDIIMLGEIRDSETANIAIQAAQTGHLVLSTLHTNSAIETVTRLQAMNILSYNIATSLSLIIAQRLIRKLCEHCKKPEKVTTAIFSKHIDWIFRATGCARCTHGYNDRTAIYEFLPINEKIMSAIFINADTTTLLATARQNHFVTLKETLLEKVAQGITSLAEANRVLQL